MSETNPLALSNREEDELLKATKAEALQKCDDLVREFAQCSTGRTVSVAWACRDSYRKLQDCMRTYSGQEAMSARRREFLHEKRSKLQGNGTFEAQGASQNKQEPRRLV